MAAMPLPTNGHEDAMLASQCLDFCQMLTGKSITFSFSLTTRTGFSFSVDTRGKEALASMKKKKKPTPSTLKRNARRREEFLKKKFNASPEMSSQGEPAAAKEAEVPVKAPSGLRHHPSPSPSSERRQVLLVGRKEKARPTFSQLDGDPPSCQLDGGSSPPTPPPPTPLRCELWVMGYAICGKTFTSDDEFKCHIHDVHPHVL